jgi:hypothetical protein
MRADFWQARRALHWSDPASASARSGGHYRRRSMTDRGGWVEVTAGSGHGRERRRCCRRASQHGGGQPWSGLRGQADGVGRSVEGDEVGDTVAASMSDLGDLERGVVATAAGRHVGMRSPLQARAACAASGRSTGNGLLRPGLRCRLLAEPGRLQSIQSVTPVAHADEDRHDQPALAVSPCLLQ